MALYYARNADRVVAEVNQGGAMVEQVLREVDPDLPFRPVHATRGKQARAEPVAALYEQGRVSHVGAFAALEDEMCSAIGEGQKSPDRLDALVWAVSDLDAAETGGAEGKDFVVYTSRPGAGIRLNNDKFTR